jgi:hypothetical protein
LKKHFKVLVTTPEYSLKTQAQLVLALIVIHNFIRIFDPEDLPEPDDDNNGPNQGTEENTGRLQMGVSVEEKSRATKFRDEIAKKMWQDYQRWKANQGRRTERI